MENEKTPQNENVVISEEKQFASLRNEYDNFVVSNPDDYLDYNDYLLNKGFNPDGTRYVKKTDASKYEGLPNDIEQFAKTIGVSSDDIVTVYTDTMEIIDKYGLTFDKVLNILKTVSKLKERNEG